MVAKGREKCGWWRWLRKGGTLRFLLLFFPSFSFFFISLLPSLSGHTYLLLHVNDDALVALWNDHVLLSLSTESQLRTFQLMYHTSIFLGLSSLCSYAYLISWEY